MRQRGWIPVLLAAVLIQPTDLDSCGPFVPRMVFTFVRGPEQPEKAFAGGPLGVVRPSFDTRSLILSYRTLAGAPLTPEQTAAVFPQPKAPEPENQELSKFSSTAWESPAAARWLLARSRVPGAPAVTELHVTREIQSTNSYVSFENCLADSFDSAIKTLDDRSAKWGATSPKLKEWLAGQDAVFANCSGKPTIPPVQTAAADPLLTEDRQYQIAAAYFYAGQYDQAEKQFAAVARRANSPWRGAAPYLEARAYIRQATVQEQKSAWPQAQAILQKTISDPQESAWHEPSRKMLGFIESRTEPQRRLAELGQALMDPKAGGASVAATVDELGYLYRRTAGSIPEGSSFPDSTSDAIDWITAMRRLGKDSAGHAVGRWKATHSQPWLVAALALATADSAAIPDLLNAAKGVPRTSPAYASTAYYSAALLARRGQIEAARQIATDALRQPLPQGTKNLLYSLRLPLATTWDDYLRNAVRTPVGESYDGTDQQEAPFSADEAGKHPAAAFDEDSVHAFNEELPLSRWSNAAQNPILSKPLQKDLVQAGWTRAALLGQRDDVREFAQRWAALEPGRNASLQEVSNAAEGDPFRFAVALFLLRNPGLMPTLRAGFQRTAPLAEIDSLRDNWWLVGPSAKQCGDDAANAAVEQANQPNAKPVAVEQPPGFLPPQELQQGRQQWQQLTGMSGNGVNLLGEIVLAWADKNQQDPRAPEALALVVRSTRYRPCMDKRGGQLSLQAFQKLHSRYKTSEWAKKTPYWFK